MATTQVRLDLTTRTSTFSIVGDAGPSPVFAYAGGRVTGDGRPKSSLPFEVFVQLHAETQRWIETVDAACSPPATASIAYEAEIKRDADTVSGKWEVGSPKPLKNSLSYAKATDTITADARPAIEIEWESFKRHSGLVDQFRIACKSF